MLLTLCREPDTYFGNLSIYTKLDYGVAVRHNCFRNSAFIYRYCLLENCESNASCLFTPTERIGDNDYKLNYINSLNFS